MSDKRPDDVLTTSERIYWLRRNAETCEAAIRAGNSARLECGLLDLLEGVIPRLDTDDETLRRLLCRAVERVRQQNVRRRRDSARDCLRWQLQEATKMLEIVSESLEHMP